LLQIHIGDSRFFSQLTQCRLIQILVFVDDLDDSTDKNGPLRVLPGTHTMGVFTDDAIEGLAAEIDRWIVWSPPVASLRCGL